jgi:hypothetical protein
MNYIDTEKMLRLLIEILEQLKEINQRLKTNGMGIL